MTLKQEGIVNTLNIKQTYFKALAEMPVKINHDRGIRKMRERLWEEFDSTWIKYNKKEATFQQWNKALNRWLNAERI